MIPSLRHGHSQEDTIGGEWKGGGPCARVLFVSIWSLSSCFPPSPIDGLIDMSSDPHSDRVPKDGAKTSALSMAHTDMCALCLCANVLIRGLQYSTFVRVVRGSSLYQAGKRARRGRQNTSTCLGNLTLSLLVSNCNSGMFSHRKYYTHAHHIHEQSQSSFSSSHQQVFGLLG